jgi:hypothetical protein
MKSDAVYLQHILDAIHKIELYVAVGRDVFMSTSHWQDAVIRQFEIIGEQRVFQETSVPGTPRSLGSASLDCVTSLFTSTSTLTLWRCGISPKPACLHSRNRSLQS